MQIHEKICQFVMVTFYLASQCCDLTNFCAWNENNLSIGYYDTCNTCVWRISYKNSEFVPYLQHNTNINKIDFVTVA